MFVIVIFLVIIYLSIKLFRNNRKIKLQKTDAIFITGCDSGIGHSFALYCHELGMTVFAGCLQLSEGAFRLEELDNVHVIPLDVTCSRSVKNMTMQVQKILGENPGTELKALVNNAGIMIFGEFAWQTESQILEQIQVNLIGAMKVTSALLPHIVKNQGRIINICSHCSLQALPGSSVYSASKAGLLAWSNALRVELKKFNVHVISFIPGDFPFITKIFANQNYYAAQMESNMSESNWALYKSYFKEYFSYLEKIPKVQKVEKIKSNYLYNIFDDALRLIRPKAHYCHSNWRYWFYHLVFKLTPTSLRDYFVLRFVNMPKWKRTE